jgi:PAS domain S-box-containing protein
VVVCVDDDRAEAARVAAAIDERSGDVRTVVESSADGVLEALERADGIVSGSWLGEGGADLLAAIRDRDADVPFLVYDGEAVAAAAITAGVTLYVPAGVPLEVLADRTVDVVERARSRARLERTRETYRSLLDAAPVPVWVQGLETIKYANESAAEMYGVEDPEDLVGRSALEMVPEEDQSDVVAANEEMIANSGSATALEGPFLRASGEERYGLFAGACITFRGEEAIVVIARDITDRQEREESLRERNERLEEFASVLSHDLRNPLAVAAAAAREARRQVQTAQVGADDAVDRPVDQGADGATDSDSGLETAVDLLGSVIDAHDRMDDITDRLLRLARTGRTVEDPVEVSLEAASRRAWSGVETGGAELVVGSDRRLLADPGRFTELLENLFANAYQHGDATEVRVDATPTGFCVTDDGDGVSEAVRERAFEFGYTTEGTGTGFGLAIVQRIATAHDWSVAFDDPGESDPTVGARVLVDGVSSPPAPTDDVRPSGDDPGGDGTDVDVDADADTA